MPNGDVGRVEPGKRLTAESRKPKIGIVLQILVTSTINYRRTANSVTTKAGEVKLSLVLADNTQKEILVGNETLGFQPVVMA